MRKLNRLQKILSFLIGIVVLITVIFGFLKSSIILRYGYDIVAMGKFYLLQSPVESIKATIESFDSMNNLEAEYEKLKTSQLKTIFLQNENNELKRQIEELTKLTNMQNMNSQFNYKSATIINRDVNSWNDELVINVGENHGIQIGNIVVGDSGIIGKITQVNPLTSKVTLVTSSKSINQVSATVVIDDKTQIDGIVQGFNRIENAIELRILMQDVEIKEGSAVITSGLGKLYPAGITIGKVKSSKKLDNELGQQLNVEIAQNLEQLRFVSVIVGSK